MKFLADKYSLNENDLIAALDNLNKGDVYFYAMSGKMGAGKDTIGDLIFDKLKSEGKEIISVSYSTPIKQEIQEIMNLSATRNPLLIADKYNAKVEEIVRLTQLLGKESIYERSAQSRRAIQYWGTDVRRKQDSNYWVKKLAQIIVKSLKDNISVYVSDVRFPNEADSIIDLKGKIIRLKTSESVRIKRIVERDNLKPTEEHLKHLSEIALDRYEFEKIFNGEDTPENLLNEILQYIK